MYARLVGFLALALLVAWSPCFALADDGAAPADDGTADAKPAVPAEGDARTAWIAETLQVVTEGEAADRRAAIAMLLKHDDRGDTTYPLTKLLSQEGLSRDALVDVVRAVGIDQLDAAREPLAALLSHDEVYVRGNAAVSLEYVGGTDAVAPLKKALKREKIPSVRHHLMRALGRCGAGEGSVRSLLVKHLKKAKSNDDVVGPALGLAYFEGDRSAARKIEAILLKRLIPKGMTMGIEYRPGAHLMAWALSEIADPKTPKFLRDDVIQRLHNTTRGSIMSSTGGGEMAYYEAIAGKIEGDPSAREKVDAPFQGAGSVALPAELGGGRTRTVTSSTLSAAPEMDAMRKGRDMSSFHPKGDRRTVPPTKTR